MMDVAALAAAPVTYAAVGGTRAPDLLAYPPAGFRSSQHSARIGHGAERWAFATAEVMSWGIKRRAGFRVESVVPAVDHSEHLFTSEGLEVVRAGDTAIIGIGLVREPVRVVYTIEEEREVGFGYGTLPGHPLEGEEAFMLERRADDSVWLTVRAFAHPARSWRALALVLRVARAVVVRRYLRVLAVKL
jgi:uncharacterized protein (UPF0548 family)